MILQISHPMAISIANVHAYMHIFLEVLVRIELENKSGRVDPF